MNIHERSNRILNYRKIAQIFLNEKFQKIFKSANFKLSPESSKSSKNPKNITSPWEWVIMTSWCIYPEKSELGTLKERVQNNEFCLKFFQKSTFSWEFWCFFTLGWILSKTPCHFKLFATIQYREVSLIWHIYDI